jgi:hypothetical protein
MTQKYFPVEEFFREWRKDSEYVAAYDALEDEFAATSALNQDARRHDTETGRQGCWSRKSLPGRDA